MRTSKRASTATRKPRKTKSKAKVKANRSAVARHRTNMRRQGMKLVQFWVPDPDAPGYAEECRRQSAIAAKAAADRRSGEAQTLRELEAWAGELLAGEPDYDWGPEGPPKP